jgi:uncharacterized protein
MKLHLTTAGQQNLITHYGSESVAINHQHYTGNLVVMPETLMLDWHQASFAELVPESFLPLVEVVPEVVLLGTGASHQFLHPKLYRLLTERGIPLECMSTAAACRTYNILMAEGRQVAAALILK